MNKRHWVDLTDLITWKGIYTGIPRTIFNIAQEYSKREDAGFFWYDERSGNFYEVDFSVVVPKPVGEGVQVGSSALKTYLRAVTKAKQVYASRVPSHIKQKVTPVIKPVLRKTFYSAKSAKNKLKRAKSPSVNSVLNFKDDDRIIIIGAGWGKPSIVKRLAEIKETTKLKVIHFIHDMIPVYHPQFFGPGFPRSYMEYMYDAIAVTDSVVTNSKASKGDIERFCLETGLSQPPIQVVRLSDVLDNESIPRRPSDLPEGEFIMCVGTIEVRKNHRLLYQTYKLAALEGVDLPHLVIVGRPGWLVKDLLFEIQTDPVTQAKITILNNSTDAELKWLYQNCKLSVYPSVYEGWGMPIAESLAYGKMCLSSSTSSMPEIAGELIDYFSPFDPRGLLNLLAAYEDNNILTKKQEIIKKSYVTQSWHSTYSEMQKSIEATT